VGVEREQDAMFAITKSKSKSENRFLKMGSKMENFYFKQTFAEQNAKFTVLKKFGKKNEKIVWQAIPKKRLASKNAKSPIPNRFLMS
jgi:hypothetical protein